MGRETLKRYLFQRISNSQEKIDRDVQRSNQFLKSFKSFQTNKQTKTKMTKFNIKNPNTNRVWKLQELHDAYSDSQLHVIALQGRVSELETKVNPDYNWSTVCKQFRSLLQKEIAQESRAIFKDVKSVYSSLSFELINHPRK